MDDADLTETALAAHATWFADAACSSTAGVRSGRQAEHLSFAQAERANIDTALAWCIDPRPAARAHHRQRIRLGLGRTRGQHAACTRITGRARRRRSDGPGPTTGPTALLLAAWLEASTGDLERARSQLAEAAELAEAIGDVDLQARGCYYLAYVVSHDGEFRQAIDAHRPQPRPLPRPRPAVGSGRELAVHRHVPRSRPATTCAASTPAIRSQQALRTVDDPWLHVRRDAMLGELARLQHRFDDAVEHIARAAATSRRLGFLQTEAYQLSSLGRAQCQAGDYDTGSCRPADLPIDKAEATGDLRMAALARVASRARSPRRSDSSQRARTVLESAAAWHRAAGGGEQALLGECLLAAMDAADEVPGAHERLAAILDASRTKGEAHVEVFALDALARDRRPTRATATRHDALSEAADRRMEAASHFITDLDRTDALEVRNG